jgi:hypothetical protein
LKEDILEKDEEPLKKKTTILIILSWVETSPPPIPPTPPPTPPTPPPTPPTPTPPTPTPLMSTPSSPPSAGFPAMKVFINIQELIKLTFDIYIKIFYYQ